MLFNSFTFLYFFVVVLAARWMAPRRLVPGVLLLSSFVFYASWEPIYLLLLVGSTVFAFSIGLAIERRRDRAGRLVALGAVGCLGVLAWFKYAGFLSKQFDSLIGWMWTGESLATVDVILPLGISFFIFQQLSYIVDVYRGAPAERSLTSFALYVSFFPQLIAGPIVRSNELIPQIENPSDFDAEQAASGVDLFVRGMLKKVVIADNLAIWSDKVFAAPADFGTLGTWLGVLCYAGQIYGDFSGYTDMARGAARLLGFELPENFNLPYLSKSITEFWRRWHITLSSWLRDYLYISLGGNRRGKSRQLLNLMITMGLGGLWHGAAWTFVIWGIFHGVLLIVHKVWRRVTAGTLIEEWRSNKMYGAVAMMATFVAVCLGWVVFRAPDATTAWEITSNLAGFAGAAAGEARPEGSVDDMWRASAFVGALGVGHILGAWQLAHRAWERLPAPLRGLAWAGGVALIYLFATRSAEFIYFQF